MKIASGVLCGGALLALSGCTVGPNYTRPQTPAAPTYRSADNGQQSSDAASLGDKGWEQVFTPPELQELIRTALANNFDLRIAAQHILEQQAEVKIVRSQQFPSINAGGTGIGAQLPQSLGSSIGSPLSFGSFSISGSWSPDFWGIVSPPDGRGASAASGADLGAARRPALHRFAGGRRLYRSARARSSARHRQRYSEGHVRNRST
ncbi:MAG: TolC family protein [Ignavibacteriota bacterium]